jgi:hypothetical protein
MQRTVYDIRVELPQAGNGKMQVTRVQHALRELLRTLDGKEQLFPVAPRHGHAIIATAGVRKVDD